MNKALTLIFLGLVFQLPVRAADTSSTAGGGLLDYVNILQGTDSSYALSHGNTIPLVGMPWGMIDWSVENNTDSAWIYYRWFFHPNGTIDGFRATHQPSPWMGDYGQFVLMPQSGDLQMDTKARSSEYDTNASILRPDYEKLELKKGRITAELTATERSAVFRFTFHEGDSGRLIINAAGGSEINIAGRAIRGLGRANSGGVPENFAQYFVIELDRDIVKSDVFVNHASTGNPSGKGDDVAAYVEFKTAPDDPVILRVGTSLISWEQAEQNLQAETAGGFDAVHARVQKTWEDNLGRIEIAAGDDQKKTFYSCLYRAQMFPHRLYELDADGNAIHYSPYDGRIHKGVLYGDIGMWDGFRTTFPLLSIIFPSQYQEILRGFVNIASESGLLPEWPSPGARSGMPGQHCAALFADAVAKGETNFDVATAYKSLRLTAFADGTWGGRDGGSYYLKLGYIPDGGCSYALSTTLDYAYDDWCIAQIAKQLGRLDDYTNLMARAQNYRKLWDPSVGFMRPKNADGDWVGTFDQFAWGGSYAEGGPWQCSWFAPHDTAGLASLLGGGDKLAAKLDQMLGLPPVFHPGGYAWIGVIHEMAEMADAKFGQYDQGNQPGFDDLYLFAAVGQPWQTEYWTRRVCAELFNSGEDGFPGDEDNGSMASWYLLSSIGLYSLCPGTPEYVLTSPVFQKVTLHLPQDKTFVISTSSNSEKNVYVQRSQLNGKDDSRTFITQPDIMQGGELHMDMGADANIHHVSNEDLPYSASP